MSRPRKSYYQYDPFRHETKRVDLKEIANLYDLTMSNVRKYIKYSYVVRGYNVLLYSHKPTISEKRRANEKIKPHDELWKYNKKLDIYVSNYGRMKMYLQNTYQFKLLNDDGVALYVSIGNSKYRALNIIYETFFGEVKNGYIAYPKSGIRNDLYYTNIDIMTKWEYQRRFKSESQKKTVIVYDENGHEVNRFKGVADASSEYFLSQQAMAHRCQKELTIDGLTFKYENKSSLL